MARQYEKKKTLIICKFYPFGTCNRQHCQYLHAHSGDDDNDDYDEDLKAFCSEMYTAEHIDEIDPAEMEILLDYDEEVVEGPDGEYIVKVPLA